MELTYSVTTDPDFSGFKFYVEEGQFFEITDYVDAYKVNRHDISTQSIHAVQDACGHLNPGEFLLVEHEK